MIEHVRAGIRARRIGFIEKGEGAIGVALADQFHGHFAGADVEQLVAAVNHLALGILFHFEGKEIHQ